MTEPPPARSATAAFGFLATFCDPLQKPLFFNILYLTFISISLNFYSEWGKVGNMGEVFFHQIKSGVSANSYRFSMSSFKGRFSYSIDNKGRIALPAKLRKSVSPEANESFVLTRGFEQCLFVYPQDEWNKL